MSSLREWTRNIFRLGKSIQLLVRKLDSKRLMQFFSSYSKAKNSIRVTPFLLQGWWTGHSERWRRPGASRLTKTAAGCTRPSPAVWRLSTTWATRRSPCSRNASLQSRPSNSCSSSWPTSRSTTSCPSDTTRTSRTRKPKTIETDNSNVLNVWVLFCVLAVRKHPVTPYVFLFFKFLYFSHKLQMCNVQRKVKGWRAQTSDTNVCRNKRSELGQGNI